MMKSRPVTSALSALAILALFYGSASLVFAQSETGRRKPVLNQTKERQESQSPKQDAAKRAKQEKLAQRPGEKTKAVPKSESEDTPKDKAWGILQEGIEDKGPERRAKAVRALGLLPGNAVAEAIADKALKDDKGVLREAAAEALGSMNATHSIPQLRAILG